MAAGRILTPVQMLEEIVSHVRNSLGVQPIYIATNYDGIALGVTEAVQKIAPPSEVVEILTHGISKWLDLSMFSGRWNLTPTE